MKTKESNTDLKNMKENSRNTGSPGKENILIGRNAVSEALSAGRETAFIVAAKRSEGSAKKIIACARDRNIPVRYEEKAVLDKIAGGKNHQGIIAYVSEYRYSSMDEMMMWAEQKGEDPFLVLLDGIEDPHNLGAIIRTAECAGAHGIVIPKRRSVGVTETAAKVSAGASEHMMCAQVTNLSRTLEDLKKKGLWIVACDMDGKTIYPDGEEDPPDLTGPLGIVIGAEGSGIGRLIKEKCDFAVSIPVAGKIKSLNASNAAAVLMYEIRRQRNEKK